MFRLIRVPLALDQFFQPVEQHVHWNHCSSFRWLVVVIAGMWGRRPVANRYRDLEGEHHRTRVHNFFLVERWDPAAVLRQKAHELRIALPPQPGDTVYVMIDDAKKAKRGCQRDAVTNMQDPTTEAYLRGPQDVCAILAYPDHVMPLGIRLYVTPAPGEPLGLPFHKTTELAAQLIRAFQAPAGVPVMVLFAAYDLCRTVVQACHDPACHVAATRQGHRCLSKPGWKLTAGRDGQHLLRRHRTTALILAKPQGSGRYRCVAAGWLQVSTLGPLHLVFSRKGRVQKRLGLMTDDPELSAAGLMQTDDIRWAVELFFKDCQPRLGLGHDQQRA
jgi:hypothetical protein